MTTISNCGQMNLFNHKPNNRETFVVIRGECTSFISDYNTA